MIYAGEDKILAYLQRDKKANLKLIIENCSINIDKARRIIESLKGKGLVEVKSTNNEEFLNSEELEKYLSKKEFPEYSLFVKVYRQNNETDGIKLQSLIQSEKKIALPWAIKKSFLFIDNGILKTKVNIEEANKINSRLISMNFDDADLVKELLKRKLLSRQEKKDIEYFITEKGIKTDSSSLKAEFSIDVETDFAPIGKTHPLSREINKMKEIFVEMGFEEMKGEFVENTFWNFEALFQPQDHPARELADTFYVDKEFDLPNSKLVAKIKKAHEDGWKYKWDKNEAKRGVLRTHTTCLSVRHLNKMSEMGAQYKKYFSVGRVFRNEEMDFKHLAEFHQVEGIIAWKNATFRDLLGVLKEFYNKLGFKNIRFRPSYFPYTEPSLEIQVYYEPKKEWMELGGAGIFRPEVSKQLTDVYPVLAWGLSLERPLMLSLGLNDIRTFYKNDINWLRKSKVEG